MMPAPVAGLFGVPWLSLAGVAGGGTFVVGLAILRLMLVNGLPWFKQFTDNRVAMRVADRNDLHDCHERLDKVEARMAAGEVLLRERDGRLIYALNAIVILATEVQKISPRSIALRQAHKLLAMAYPIEGVPANIADILKPLENVE